MTRQFAKEDPSNLNELDGYLFVNWFDGGVILFFPKPTIMLI